MSITSNLLIELDRETQNTRRLLENIANEHLAWKPHERSMSLGQLAGHTVDMTNLAAAVITVDEFDFQKDFKAADIGDVDNLLLALDEGHIKNKSALTDFPDERWPEVWTFKSGDYVISKGSKLDAIRSMINNHVYHHRGQLTVYLRLLNIPVPGLYGPSADDRR